MELLKKASLLGLGALSLSKEKIDSIVDEMVKKGELTQEEGKKIFDDLISKGEDNKKTIEKIIHDSIAKIMDASEISQKKDITDLKSSLDEIHTKLNQIIDSHPKEK